MKHILEERYILCEAEDFGLTDTDELQVEDDTGLADNNSSVQSSQKIIKLANGNYNWAEMYKMCKSPQDFEWFWHGKTNQLEVESDEKSFEGYYKEEWGNYADMTESFGKLFTDDLLALGWFPQTNPFIIFLKKYFTINKGTQKFVPDAYRVLHNAAAKNYIGAHDLTNSEETSNNLINIIYAPDTFKNLGDTLKYLQLQQLIKTAFDTEKIEATSLRHAVLNLMLKAGDPENLNTDIPPNTRALRPLSECEILITPLVDAEVQATDIDVNQAINKISKTDARLALTAVVMLLTGSHSDMLGRINRQKNGKLFTITDTVTLTPKNQRAWQERLGLKTKKFNPPELEKLIVGLLSKIDKGN